MAQKSAPWKILSVGGSIIIPKTGFDTAFLKKFRAFILRRIRQGERLILVVGGGATCRAYQQAAAKVRELTTEDLDWIGIHSTIFNAHFVRLLFKEYAHDQVVTNPTKKVKTDKPIIVAAAWKPGHSTDYDAVLLAKTYGVKEVINLSNIEYVYDRDPNLYPDAQKIETIDWKTFRREIVGNVWEAGKNAPFDPIASRRAEKLRLKVSILRGTDLSEVGKALDGKKFKGTIIQ